jgi:hypothetical protein
MNKRRAFFAIVIIPALLLVVLFLPSCRPTITSIYPTSGPPGTLVHVTGANLFGGLIKWDAGATAERTLPGGFMGASFFTVPMDVNLGAHNVRLFGDGHYSSDMVTFTVTTGTQRPAPRVDDITCRSFVISESGRASFVLMVHGANIDAGAQILINGVAQSSFFWRGLSNQQNMLATDPATLGYPIFHYGTLICGMTNVIPGDSLLNVTVRNIDGRGSVNARTYYVAPSMLLLDSDGDGLTDDWERNGVDVDGDDTIDVDLPALGANYLRKDIFLEVDWMAGLEPERGLWPYVDSIYRNAPVLNCDGSSGISLHMDHGQGGVGGTGGGEIPFVYGIHYGTFTCDYPVGSGRACINFHALKRQFFDSSKLRISRYCIVANRLANAPYSGGQAEGEWSNDFIICNGFNLMISRDTLLRYQIGGFLHEFGHTLGLHHGGADQYRRKPNYNSVENNNLASVGVDVDCNPLTYDYRLYTYSQGMNRTLNEACLNEREGICDHVAVDWNEDGSADGMCIRKDLTEYDSVITELLDYSDWAFFKLDFTKPGSFWHNN